MGLLKGSGSFVRFSVEGEMPENPLEYIGDRIISFSFNDIDDTYDEYSIGWVSITNMFDNDFKHGNYMAGDYITLSLRIDERKVSTAILNKYIAKEEERVKQEKEIRKISRAMKVEIKERVKSEMTRKAYPMPVVFDLCWNLSAGTLLFFSTNKKIHETLEDFFKESFGMNLKRQIPYLQAEAIVGEEKQHRLDILTPDIFV
ncbi:MAG: recombination-associated protein RdgC [Desulfotalea sp.]